MTSVPYFAGHVADAPVSVPASPPADPPDPPPPVAPSLVGRSPSYTFRQLYDIQRGTRNGANIASTMRPVVAQLTEGDLIDIAAYLASRIP